MINIELERKKLELRRVQQATAEMEFSILEKSAEIERIKTQIEIQKKKEKEIIEYLKTQGVE